MLVAQQKSEFEISIAKTRQSVAKEQQKFNVALRAGKPVDIVACAAEIKGLEEGLTLLETYYAQLFPSN